MGRKKITVSKIEDERTRNITFTKRKAGLIKKAMELSILCDCEVSLVVFSKDNDKLSTLYEYSSVDPRYILQKYCSVAHEPHERFTNQDYEIFQKSRKKDEPLKKRGRKKKTSQRKVKNTPKNNNDTNNNDYVTNDYVPQKTSIPIPSTMSNTRVTRSQVRQIQNSNVQNSFYNNTPNSDIRFEPIRPSLVDNRFYQNPPPLQEQEVENNRQEKNDTSHRLPPQRHLITQEYRNDDNSNVGNTYSGSPEYYSPNPFSNRNQLFDYPTPLTPLGQLGLDSEILSSTPQEQGFNNEKRFNNAKRRRPLISNQNHFIPTPIDSSNTNTNNQIDERFDNNLRNNSNLETGNGKKKRKRKRRGGKKKDKKRKKDGGGEQIYSQLRSLPEEFRGGVNSFGDVNESVIKDAFGNVINTSPFSPLMVQANPRTPDLPNIPTPNLIQSLKLKD